MPSPLRISEASSLAMHAMALLALDPRRSLSTKTIASSFRVSEAHLSKVMQRLVKVGLLRSARGPKGGFSLARDPARITLLDVFEVVEGPFESDSCVFGLADCDGRSCILGAVLHEANQRLKQHLATSDLKTISATLAGRDFALALGRDR